MFSASHSRMLRFESLTAVPIVESHGRLAFLRW
jgi:hypothetical protein